MIPQLEPDAVSFVSIMCAFIAAGSFAIGVATVYSLAFKDSRDWQNAYFDKVNESERRLSDALARENELRKKLVDTLPKVEDEPKLKSLKIRGFELTDTGTRCSKCKCIVGKLKDHKCPKKKGAKVKR